LGEHRRQEPTHELIGRQLGQHQRLLQGLLGDVGRQRAAPPGVGRRQDQRHRDGGVSAVELQSKRAAERQPGHVRPFQPEPVDEAGQAVGVAGHAKRFRRIG
jgi:hypothetical protein